jgi:hypothetical protein
MGSPRPPRTKPARPAPADPANASDEEDVDITQRSRDEQITWVFEILFGQGVLEKDEAVRRVTTSLAELGLADAETAAEPGPVRTAIERALDAGIKQGLFDRPKRGHVRAIRADAKDYSLDDWSLVLRSSIDREPTARDAALRFAAYWAATNMGLSFSRLREGGAILNGLDTALRSAIERGEVIADDPDLVRKA